MAGNDERRAWGLPRPLNPEKVEPYGIPELRPKTPARYSQSTSDASEEQADGNKEAEHVDAEVAKCPICDKRFDGPNAAEDCNQHVEIHLPFQCPICFLDFPQGEDPKFARAIQAHVNTHFDRVS